MVVNDLAVAHEVVPVLQHRLLLGLQLEEAERVLAGQERGYHGDHGADGGAQVSGVHQVVETLLFHERSVLGGQKASPFSDLENDKIDKIGDGDNERQEEKSLSLERAQRSRAPNQDNGYSSEAILREKIENK